jgi:hypothetical protein
MKYDGESIDWLRSPVPPPSIVNSALLALSALVARPVFATVTAISRHVRAPVLNYRRYDHELDS